VNELEFIRSQVSTERSHMAAVRSACAAALALAADPRPDIDFLAACAGYLIFSVGRFNAQDQAHCGLLRPRLPADAARDLATLDELEQTLGMSRKAIEPLATALGTLESGTGDAAEFTAALRTYLSFYSGVLAPRRHALRHLFDAHYGIADWRAASAVDADSILEERERYARVADLRPGGIALGAQGTDAPVPPPLSGSAAQAATRPTGP